MKIRLWVMLSCLSLGLLFSMGCDGSSGGVAMTEPESVITDPPTDILPYLPPGTTESPEEIGEEGGGGDEPGGGGGSPGGGEDPPGGGEQPVPEPSTLILVGSGLVLISLCKKKKKPEEEIEQP